MANNNEANVRKMSGILGWNIFELNTTNDEEELEIVNRLMNTKMKDFPSFFSELLSECEKEFDGISDMTLGEVCDKFVFGLEKEE